LPGPKTTAAKAAYPDLIAREVDPRGQGPPGDGHPGEHGVSSAAGTPHGCSLPAPAGRDHQENRPTAFGPWRKDVEVTVEANPETVGPARAGSNFARVGSHQALVRDAGAQYRTWLRVLDREHQPGRPLRLRPLGPCGGLRGTVSLDLNLRDGRGGERRGLAAGR